MASVIKTKIYYFHSDSERFYIFLFSSSFCCYILCAFFLKKHSIDVRNINHLKTIHCLVLGIFNWSFWPPIYISFHSKFCHRRERYCKKIAVFRNDFLRWFIGNGLSEFQGDRQLVFCLIIFSWISFRKLVRNGSRWPTIVDFSRQNELFILFILQWSENTTFVLYFSNL